MDIDTITTITTAAQKHTWPSTRIFHLIIPTIAIIYVLSRVDVDKVGRYGTVSHDMMHKTTDEGRERHNLRGLAIKVEHDVPNSTDKGHWHAVFVQYPVNKILQILAVLRPILSLDWFSFILRLPVRYLTFSDSIVNAMILSITPMKLILQESTAIQTMCYVTFAFSHCSNIWCGHLRLFRPIPR